MKDCKDCDLAVYCYSDPNSWTFRTKDQVHEVEERMAACERFQTLPRQERPDSVAGGEPPESPPKAAGAADGCA